MESGVYRLTERNAILARGVEYKDGMGRPVVMDSRHIRKSDGYLHDQYFWVVRGGWVSLSEQQVAALAAKGLCDVTDVMEA